MAQPGAPMQLTTEQIQKMLDDNFTYLKAIVDQQNLQRLPEMQQYQEKLQHNLMLLAKIADGNNPGGAAAGAAGAGGSGQ
mmetsp:Transcript_20322/g.51471  ORF Transcript_20322/g.51471 Transcript_20322/m.51471 type:complete len:80 (+) Transcript_20322:78-317(+)|eukprot:CAMPEP_0202867614 /NCGR_PEP_ID=MMETSP1391-20130828/9528_1 /ASSEMBLY_ACC=CAM_ASM_000867 /TAXON_ID=1034604 /ORGANISM="Chlamydomonas leiostraca, Strain SAG 11-49" /LENGTH=79 /DNA_ID=CAMNT_0049547667 /DNA_START=78 /DNA_END=317 /DNA_ORIENTATION=-